MEHSILSPEELLNRINKIEQTRLGYFPTPLEAWERLRTHLDHSGTLLCKRDDQSGLAFGGNKVRQLEFLLADAMQQGADTIVFAAAVQSNYARMLSAACSKLGLHCHLILSRAYQQPLNQGNILLDRIVGATVEFSELPLGGMSENQLSQVAETLRARGKTPYLILYPESEILGALSYVKAATELYEQCQSLAALPGYLVCAAVGATQAGLLLGSRLLGWDVKVLGFSPLRSEFSVRETIAYAIRRVSELLEVQNPVKQGDIINTADYVGDGYAIATDAGVRAITIVARNEGVFLDPVYTGKAMAGLLDYLAQGRIDRQADIVFVHTGGTPALFAYSQEILKRLEISKSTSLSD